MADTETGATTVTTVGRRYTPDELTALREAHRKWLYGQAGGVRAVLSGADLRNAVLSGADLRNADLSGAVLSGADLRNADLSGAVLRNADLRNAVLSGADLRNAVLRNAVLSGADLRNADLRNAVLDTGERWEDYLSDVVPALLAAGGHPVTPEAWACHNWTNCPMAEAFGVHDLAEIPLLLRPRASQFVTLYDAGLIPAPVVATATDTTTATE